MVLAFLLLVEFGHSVVFWVGLVCFALVRTFLRGLAFNVFGFFGITAAQRWVIFDGDPIVYHEKPTYMNVFVRRRLNQALLISDHFPVSLSHCQ